MNVSQVYIAVSIGVLLVIAILLAWAGRQGRVSRLTPLGGLAFAFVVAGTFFGSSRLVGYGLMAVGVLLAFIDILNRRKKP
jgi:hypothetical protein